MTIVAAFQTEAQRGGMCVLLSDRETGMMAELTQNVHGIEAVYKIYGREIGRKNMHGPKSHLQTLSIAAMTHIMETGKGMIGTGDGAAPSEVEIFGVPAGTRIVCENNALVDEGAKSIPVS
jgi:hypothetical protein